MESVKREYALLICDCFETLLDEHDIKIPNEDREGNDGEACIYGDDWGNLIEHVNEYLGDFYKVMKEKESKE